MRKPLKSKLVAWHQKVACYLKCDVCVLFLQLTKVCFLYASTFLDLLHRTGHNVFHTPWNSISYVEPVSKGSKTIFSRWNIYLNTCPYRTILWAILDNNMPSNIPYSANWIVEGWMKLKNEIKNFFKVKTFSGLKVFFTGLTQLTSKLSAIQQFN